MFYFSTPITETADTTWWQNLVFYSGKYTSLDEICVVTDFVKKFSFFVFFVRAILATTKTFTITFMCV